MRLAPEELAALRLLMHADTCGISAWTSLSRACISPPALLT